MAWRLALGVVFHRIPTMNSAPGFACGAEVPRGAKVILLREVCRKPQNVAAKSIFLFGWDRSSCPGRAVLCGTARKVE